MIKKLYILFVLFYSVSCTKTIDYDIPDPGNNLVVQCVLFNDVWPVAAISTSSYSLDKTPPSFIRGANAILIEDGINTDAFYEEIDILSFYRVNKYPKEGSTYEIKAMHPDIPNLPAIEAKTIISPGHAGLPRFLLLPPPPPT